MRKRLILFFIVVLIASFFAVGFFGCDNNEGQDTGNGQGTNQNIENSTVLQPTVISSFDKSKLTVPDYDGEISAEVGGRCYLPIIKAVYDGKPVVLTVKVFDSNNGEAAILSRGTRFLVEDRNGYSVKYYITVGEGENKEEVEIASVAVNVSDTRGPTIKLPAAAYYMTVDKDEVVDIPVAELIDDGGEGSQYTVNVSYDGSDVATQQSGDTTSFIANNYGKFYVKYTATDPSGNTSEEIVEINCARKISLCDFESLDDAWGFSNGYDAELWGENNITGNACLRVNGMGGSTYVKVVCNPKYYDLSIFDRIQLYVYSTRDLIGANEGLYLLNKKYKISAGANIVSISKEDLLEEYPDGKVPSSKPVYNQENYLWFQVVASSGSVYLDNLVGVFDNYTSDKVAPVIDLGKNGCTGEYKIKAGEIIPKPTDVFGAYDNSLENIALNYSVKIGSTDVTNSVNVGSLAAELGTTYTVDMSASDSSGNTASKSVNITVYEETVYDTTGREYTVLQSFEDENFDSALNCNDECNRSSYRATDGESSARVYTMESWEALYINLKADGALLSDIIDDISFISIDVFSDKTGLGLYLYGYKFDNLKLGKNTIYISGANLKAQMNAGVSEYTGKGAYDDEGWTYFQVENGQKGYTLFIDNIRAYYLKDGESQGSGDPVTPIKTTKVLQSFDWEYPFNASLWTAFDENDPDHYPGNTENHCTEGNAAMKMTSIANYQMILINLKVNGNVLTAEELDKIESISIDIYAELPEGLAGADFFYFNQNMGWLVAGANTLTITGEEFKAQMSGNNGTPAYNADTGWAYFQIASAGITLYFDNCVATYK